MKASILSSIPQAKQVEALSYLVFEGDKLPHNPSLELINRSDFKGSDEQVLIVDNLDGYQQVVFVGVGKRKDCTDLKIQNSVASLLRLMTAKNIASVGVVVPDLSEMQSVGTSCMIGAELGAYQFLKYKTD